MYVYLYLHASLLSTFYMVFSFCLFKDNEKHFVLIARATGKQGRMVVERALHAQFKRELQVILFTLSSIWSFQVL